MKDTNWTRFMDMHSGGDTKESYDIILIEAKEDIAKIIFYNRFGHNPDRVTCTCCGADYSISEEKDLNQITAYDRGCDYAYFDKDGNEIAKDKAWKSGKGLINGATVKYVERRSKEYSWQNYITLEDYIEGGDVLIIRESEIRDEDKIGELPTEGYVWV